MLAATVATGLIGLITSHISTAGQDRPVDAIAHVLMILGGGSLALGRRRPRLVLGVVIVGLGIYLGRNYPNGPVFATGWVALFLLS